MVSKKNLAALAAVICLAWGCADGTSSKTNEKPGGGGEQTDSCDQNGAKKCADSKVMICESNKWAVNEQCTQGSLCNPDTFTCDEEVVRVCSEGAFQCKNNSLEKCDQNKWQTVKTCTGNDTCDTMLDKAPEGTLSNFFA